MGRLKLGVVAVEMERLRQTDRKSKRGREQLCFGGHLNQLCGGSPSGLPLANHLALSGFGVTQGPALCARAPFSQDGF